jgi:hypothetical protein
MLETIDKWAQALGLDLGIDFKTEEDMALEKE